MMNEKLIAETVKIVTEYFEFENIYEESVTIKARAEKWYSNTEITDPYTLAAVTMHGEFVPTITINEIKQIEEYYFPENNEHVFHIKEIEDSLDDLLFY